MTATEILLAIAQRGGWVRRDGEQLRVRIAKGQLSEELRAELLERRDEVLALVTTHPCISCR